MNKTFSSSLSTSSSCHSDTQSSSFLYQNFCNSPLVDTLNDLSHRNNNQSSHFLQPQNFQTPYPNDQIVTQDKNTSFLSKLKGLIIMLVSVVFFDLVRFTMKFSYAQAPTLSVIQLGFFRSLGMVILIFFILLANCSVKQALCNIPKRLRFFVFLRSIVGSAEVFFFIAAVSSLTYSTAVVLNFIAPLLTPLFAFAFLRQKVKFFDIIALVISFLGVIIFTNPQILGESTSSSSNQKGKSNTLIGFVFGFLTALTLALDMIVLKKIASLSTNKMQNHSQSLLPISKTTQSKSLHPMTPVFYVFVMGSIIQGTLYFIQTITQKHPRPHTNINYIHLSTYLLLSAVSGIIAQFLYSLATRYQKASKLAVMLFFQVVMGFIFESTIFHGKIGAAQIIGTLMILGSSLTVAVLKICKTEDTETVVNDSNYQKI